MLQLKYRRGTSIINIFIDACCRELEKPDFSLDLVCSTGCVPLQHLDSPFVDEINTEDILVVSIHTLLWDTSDGHCGLYYYTDMTY